MREDPFIILGLNASTANQNDVDEAYGRLKSRYQEERFLDGELGAEASRKLDELERAYVDAREFLKQRNTVDNFGSLFGEIEDLIKKGDLTSAQAKLDYVETRDAEWHYLQSVIYYKKGWNLESKTQLELACNLDPFNQKYKTALGKLNDVISGKTKSSSSGVNSNDRTSNNYTDNGNGPQQNYRSYRDPGMGGYERGMNGMDCCSSLLCADCCCECMGGDLIRCC